MKNFFNYDPSGLIQEVKSDIENFGGDCFVAVWCKKMPNGRIFFRNYDFVVDEKPIQPSEVAEDEYLKMMSLTALLIILEKQNRERYS